MTRTLFAVLVLSLASQASSTELQSLRAADLRTAEIAVPAPEAPAAAEAAGKQYHNLWMNVYDNPSWGEASATDSMARIDVSVRRFGSMFNADVRVDMTSIWVSLSKFGMGFSLSGNGLNLNMSEWSGSYNITGSVAGADNQTKFINLTLFKGFDDYSFSASGAGIHLNISRGSITGNYDDAQYSKKALAAIITLALAAQVDKMPGRAAAEKGAERFYLPIRNYPSGWYTAEASDPFSAIKVGLRKIFDRRYDAEIEAAGERENGTVDNFFARTHEYRGNRSSLRLEEWAGSYELTGDLYVKDRVPEIMKIDLRLRGTFSPGSFTVSEQGLHLTADRYGVNGEIDPAVYPKKLVAILTALSMAMQQDAPQPW